MYSEEKKTTFQLCGTTKVTRTTKYADPQASVGLIVLGLLLYVIFDPDLLVPWSIKSNSAPQLLVLVPG